MPIQSFRCRATAALFLGKRVPRFVQIERAALRKLRQLDQARSLDDLRAPPGNRLEALGGDRTGQYNIRINQQWRLCCLWRDGQPHEAEIVDYH